MCEIKITSRSIKHGANRGETNERKDEGKFSRFVSGNKRKRERYYSVAPTSLMENKLKMTNFIWKIVQRSTSQIEENEIASVVFIFCGGNQDKKLWSWNE
jgi:hypothetical protein